jgi:hypothetical protein
MTSRPPSVYCAAARRTRESRRGQAPESAPPVTNFTLPRPETTSTSLGPTFFREREVRQQVAGHDDGQHREAEGEAGSADVRGDLADAAGRDPWRRAKRESTAKPCQAEGDSLRGQPRVAVW